MDYTFPSLLFQILSWEFTRRVISSFGLFLLLLVTRNTRSFWQIEEVWWKCALKERLQRMIFDCEAYQKAKCCPFTTLLSKSFMQSRRMNYNLQNDSPFFFTVDFKIFTKVMSHHDDWNNSNNKNDNNQLSLSRWGGVYTTELGINPSNRSLQKSVLLGSENILWKLLHVSTPSWKTLYKKIMQCYYY